MSFEPVSNDGISPQSLGSETGQPLDVNKDTLFAQEIVRSRTAWYFQGRCARNTKYPVGTNSEVGGDETGAGVEPLYYNRSANNFNVDHPNLFFATHLFTSAFSDPKEDPETLVVAKTVSKDVGYDEIVIAGKYANADAGREPTGRYYLVCRIKSEEATKLYARLRSEPDFIDTFITTAFPNMDSSVDSFNGLYRLLAKKLAIIDDVQLNELSERYKRIPVFPDSDRYHNPRIPMEHAQKIIRETSVELTKPAGVGTVADFAPLKTKYNAGN